MPACSSSTALVHTGSALEHEHAHRLGGLDLHLELIAADAEVARLGAVARGAHHHELIALHGVGRIARYRDRRGCDRTRAGLGLRLARARVACTDELLL